MGSERLNLELVELPRLYRAPIRISERKVRRNLGIRYAAIKPDPNLGSVVRGSGSDAAFQAAVVPDCPWLRFGKRLVYLEICPDHGACEAGED